MPIPDTFTAEQVETTLTQALKGVTPADAKPPTLMSRLSQFRKLLQRYRGQGYSAQQIATALGQPPLNLTVSPSLVRKALASRRKKASDEAPVVYTVIDPPASAAAPQK